MKRLLVALLIVVTMCGCKNSTENNLSNGSNDTISSGGNLDIYCYNSKSFNPLFAQNNANIYMSWICFEPLIKTLDDFSATTVLAQGYFISEDSLVWTLPLRNDVKWHDGTNFTSADVVATCNTIMENKNNSVYWYNLSNVDKVVADGTYTVKFYLKSPQTNFANLLEFPIVKKGDCDKVDDFQIIGTGVFKYRNTENKSLIFDANDNWWGKSKAFIKTVTAVILPDKETSVYAFNSKVIDVVPASIKDWSNYPSASDRGIEYSTGDFFYLRFNLNNEYLSSHEIRSAIVKAIDKNTIRDKALLSHGVVTDSFINPKWKYYSDNSNAMKFNSEQAKIIKNQQIGDKKISLRLIVNENSEIKYNTSIQIKDFLSVLGIDVNIVILSWKNYVNAYNLGEYDLAICETNYSPDLIPLQVISGNENVMSLITELQKAGIDEERIIKYNNIQKAMNEELTIMPLFFDMGVLLYNECIASGLSPTRTNIYNDIQLWHLK